MNEIINASPAARRRGRIALLIVFGLVVGVSLMVIAITTSGNHDARSPGGTPRTRTPVVPLSDRPLAQSRFIADLSTYYPALTSTTARWDSALVDAENTCLDIAAGKDADTVMRNTALRFQRGDVDLGWADGRRIVRMVEEHEVCASFAVGT
ncbi:hypothetical protein [Actinokineospora terrae]|uniref:DUF732 domain-containing protein n=1 Tax=Actinokineospora terrae TaxID=155974 RepID=A0A1H9V2I3_9PSEU|nr:hypothetical protein [Actinokineospora terrae]SES15798.1 hypothetical protein SAMN04487818_1085 [Actinokineospora terrae]